MRHQENRAKTALWYRNFAELEVGQRSPCYYEWSLGISEDDELLELIESLPAAKRQPNLIIAAARYNGVGECDFSEFKSQTRSTWHDIAATALTRRTQTNEVGRMAALLPVLAGLSGPLNLIEVGASAGLCLFPDLYSYRYDDIERVDPVGGMSPVLLECTTSGPVRVPSSLPEISSRVGIDLNPLDVGSAEDARWLECLIWIGQDHRLERLRSAISATAGVRRTMIRGDLTEVIADVVTSADPTATTVVFHSAVLSYVDPEGRRRFEDVIRSLDCHWVSNEGWGVVESIAGRLAGPPDQNYARFVIALDGNPLAYTSGHGETLEWFG